MSFGHESQLVGLLHLLSFLLFFYGCLYNIASCLSKSLDMHWWFSRYDGYYRRASFLSGCFWCFFFSFPLSEKCTSMCGVYSFSEWMPLYLIFHVWRRRPDVLFILFFYVNGLSYCFTLCYLRLCWTWKH